MVPTTLAFTETEYVLASKMFVDGANTIELVPLKLIKLEVMEAGVYETWYSIPEVQILLGIATNGALYVAP